MRATTTIPEFELFGETVRFPDVVHCERIRDRASSHGWTISPHRHHHMAQLVYLEAGHSDVVLDGDTLVMSCNTCLFIPAKIVHGFSFAPDTEGIVLTFPLSVVNSLGPVASGLQECLAQPIVGQAPDRLKALLSLFIQCYSDNGTYRAQVSVGLTHSILATVAEIAHANDNRAQTVSRVRLRRLDALIAKHLIDGWGPGDYANSLSVSTGHLSRLCRDDRGMSTSSYLEAAAMAEACRLLAFTRSSIAEVGYRVGFEDPSYFSRKFRAAHGKTPTEYRAHFLDV